MIGLIVKHLNEKYQFCGCMIASLVSHREEFILEGGGYISSFQKVRDGIEFEVQVSEFEEATELISENNDFTEIDPEYAKMRQERDAEWDRNRRLKMFYEMENILKEEGYI